MFLKENDIRKQNTHTGCFAKCLIAFIFSQHCYLTSRNVKWDNDVVQETSGPQNLSCELCYICILLKLVLSCAKLLCRLFKSLGRHHLTSLKVQLDNDVGQEINASQNVKCELCYICILLNVVLSYANCFADCLKASPASLCHFV